ncbi:ABC transporter ATP-binding protein [Pseudooceanicola sp. CBS1P-1]|uniref:ATP-binding cassette domain-containing protein n=1 Tax=Pseudooceanicola albus TaxID=2692189 RepID=A0A6L7G2F4_9RHOB|nr:MULTISPECIES: ABC transporter ATP-binding protein [Pseudooceanicola]MBT9385164.1 ABC transporter ATP-binding protein [Pseudooceanicola endophyticus]MXN18544.1 ATP-binding cassette domain-containing protein [Pseudooceanicola albus]
MGNVLEVRSLSKSFGGIRAVRDVSFDLKRGEFLALIGPNGAGKTTCFNMLNGYLRPDTGSVKLLGRELVGIPPRKVWRMGVGRTFQITETFRSMTVLENVQMALISHNRRIFDLFSKATALYRDEALKLLELIGMAAQADRPCAELAYGDLKQLELAIALAHDPDLLLMDEPTAGMAPNERIALMQLTADIVARGHVSVIFTEHDMDVVFAHSHRILVLNRGELIAEGTGDEIRANALVQEVYLGGGSLFHEKETAHA